MHTNRFLGAAFAVALTACASGSNTPAAAPASGAAPQQAAPEMPVPPSQVAAMKVAKVDVRSAGRIEMMVGDSFPVTDVDAVALDASGNVVTDAPPLRQGIATVGGDASAPTFSSNDRATLRNGMVKAQKPGKAQLVIFQPRPGMSDDAPPPFGTVELSIAPRPIARVDVPAPTRTLYAGGDVSLEPVAMTDMDTPRENASFAWRSSDASIATVDDLGVVHGLKPGRATLTASSEGVNGTVAVVVKANPIASLTLTPESREAQTGDVVHFSAVAKDARGRVVADAPVTFGVVGGGPRGPLGAAIYEDGAFVAENPGTYRVVASAPGASAEAVVRATERKGQLEAQKVGTGILSETPSSDLWVFRGQDGRDYAYTGTHSGGQKMYAWDVTDPSNPTMTDSIVVDARVVNDVKVNEDASVAVITREGASDRKNGIVLLDLSTPAHPTVISKYTETLTGGVHNTFIAGNYVYAINDGTLDVHIIDISDPKNPHEVGRWGIDRDGKYLHDIWVHDGIGYVSYWNDGLYIIDLGGGAHGGTATEPVVISRIAYPEGNTHTAFPYTNRAGQHYVFVGDEIFGCDECVNRVGTAEEGPRGYIHVIDVNDIEHPKEVARYEVPEAGSHNVWVEDDKLYVGYYQAGIRVVDISGELRGDLYRQGRELAWFPTGAPQPGQGGSVVSPRADENAKAPFVPNSSFTWGPQPYKGNVFATDFNSGLWIVRFTPKERQEMHP